MPKPATPSNAQAAIVRLDLSAVALCGEGANSRADILLTKRKENTSMSFEELKKTLTPEAQATIEKHVADTVEAETKKVSDAKDAEIETMKTNHATELAKAKAKPPADDDIIKSLPPEAQALFNTMKSTMASIVETQENQRVAGLLGKMKALPATEDELKGVLKSASPAVVTLLEKAAVAMEEALSKGTGKGADGGQFQTGGDADTAYAQLEKHAKELMAKTAGMTPEKAFVEACALHPDVYKKYVEGVK